MGNQEASPEKAIRGIIRQINELWSSKRYDEIGQYLAAQVVTAPPELDQRIRGREAYVQSYREYDQTAATQDFLLGEPEVDVVGDVAVATYPFRVVYDLDGQTYWERGRELLVFSRSSGEWRVVWRTMETESTEPGPG